MLSKLKNRLSQEDTNKLGNLLYSRSLPPLDEERCLESSSSGPTGMLVMQSTPLRSVSDYLGDLHDDMKALQNRWEIVKENPQGYFDGTCKEKSFKCIPIRRFCECRACVFIHGPLPKELKPLMEIQQELSSQDKPFGDILVSINKMIAKCVEYDQLRDIYTVGTVNLCTFLNREGAEYGFRPVDICPKCCNVRIKTEIIHPDPGQTKLVCGMCDIKNCPYGKSLTLNKCSVCHEAKKFDYTKAVDDPSYIDTCIECMLRKLDADGKPSRMEIFAAEHPDLIQMTSNISDTMMKVSKLFKQIRPVTLAVSIEKLVLGVRHDKTYDILKGVWMILEYLGIGYDAEMHIDVIKYIGAIIAEFWSMIQAWKDGKDTPVSKIEDQKPGDQLEHQAGTVKDMLGIDLSGISQTGKVAARAAIVFAAIGTGTVSILFGKHRPVEITPKQVTEAMTAGIATVKNLAQLIPMMSKFADWCLTMLGIDVRTADRKALEDEIDKLPTIQDSCTSVRQLFSANPVEFCATNNVPGIIKSIRDRVTNIVSAMTKEDAQKWQGTIFDIKKNCSEMLENFVKFQVSGGTRLVPTCVYLTGETGVGKSFVASEIVKQLSALEGRELFTYTRNAGDPFWSGYAGHEVVRYDDFFANDDSSEGDELISMITDAPYSLNMASLEQKGITTFCSKYVVICSNTRVPKFKGNTNCEALESRKHFPFTVSNPGLKAHIQQYGPGSQSSWQGWKKDFSHLEFRKEVLKDGKLVTLLSPSNNEVWTLPEVVDQMYAHHKHQETIWLNKKTGTSYQYGDINLSVDGNITFVDPTNQTRKSAIPNAVAASMPSRNIHALVDSNYLTVKKKQDENVLLSNELNKLRLTQARAAAAAAEKKKRRLEQQRASKKKPIKKKIGKTVEDVHKTRKQRKNRDADEIAKTMKDFVMKLNAEAQPSCNKDDWAEASEGSIDYEAIVFGDTDDTTTPELSQPFEDSDGVFHDDRTPGPSHQADDVVVKHVLLLGRSGLGKTVFAQQYIEAQGGDTACLWDEAFVKPWDTEMEERFLTATSPIIMTSNMFEYEAMVQKRKLLGTYERFERRVIVIRFSPIKKVFERVNGCWLKKKLEEGYSLDECVTYQVTDDRKDFTLLAARVNQYLDEHLVTIEDHKVPVIDELKEITDVDFRVTLDATYAEAEGGVTSLALTSYKFEQITERGQQFSMLQAIKVMKRLAEATKKSSKVSLEEKLKDINSMKLAIIVPRGEILFKDFGIIVGTVDGSFYATISKKKTYDVDSGEPVTEDLITGRKRRIEDMTLVDEELSNWWKAVVKRKENNKGIFEDFFTVIFGTLTATISVGVGIGLAAHTIMELCKDEHERNYTERATGESSEVKATAGSKLIKRESSEIKATQGSKLVKREYKKVDSENAAQKLKEVHATTVDAQSCRDLQSIAVAETISGNYVKVPGSWGLMLCDKLGVCCLHTLPQDYFTITHRGEKFPANVVWRSSKSIDLALFEVKTDKQWKDITKHLCPGDTSYAVHQDMLLLVPTTQTMMVAHTCQLDLTTTMRRFDDTDKNVRTYTVASGNMSTFVTKPGDCGAACILIAPNCQQKLFAIHNGGTTGYGTAAFFTQPMLDLIFGYKQYGREYFLEVQEQHAPEPTMGLMCDDFSQVMPATMDAEKLFGVKTRMEVVGLLENEKNSLYKKFSPTGTKIRRSPLAINEPHATPLQPGIMACDDIRNPKKIDPLIKNFMKWNTVRAELDEKKYMAYFEEFAEYTIAQLPPNSKTRTLTKTEALNGASDYVQSHPLNRTTSSGFPFNTWNGVTAKTPMIKWSNDKQCWVIDMTTEQGKRLNHMCDKSMSAAANSNENYVAVCEVNLKDEVLPASKIYDVRTRSIVSSPLFLTINFRRLTGSVNALLQEHCHRLPMQIGLAPNTMQWDRLYKRLTRIGERGFDCDIKHFDSKYTTAFHRGYARYLGMINEYFDVDGQGEYRSKTFAKLYETMAQPVVGIDGKAIQSTDGGQLSGQLHTGMGNSVGNTIYVVDFWKTLCTDPEFSAIVGDDDSVSNMFEWVDIINQGDDIVTVCHPDLEPWWHYQNFKKHMLEVFLITVTPGKKEDGEYHSKHISEMTFLKRSFKSFYDDICLGALEFEAFEKMLDYTRVKKPAHYNAIDWEKPQWDDDITGTMYSALYEAALVSKEFYYTMKTHILECCRKYRLLPPQFRSWESTLKAMLYNVDIATNYL